MTQVVKNVTTRDNARNDLKYSRSVERLSNFIILLLVEVVRYAL